jgi:hypothetical protein
MEKARTEVFMDNAYTFMGRILENVVVGVTNKVMGRDFKLFEEGGSKIFYIHDDLKVGATPDAHENYQALLECKTMKPSVYMRYAMLPFEKYIGQLYTQMICTEIDTGYAAFQSTDFSQTGPKLKLDLSVYKITKDSTLDEWFYSEIHRYLDCKNRSKEFKVNRKLSSVLKWALITSCEKVV